MSQRGTAGRIARRLRRLGAVDPAWVDERFDRQHERLAALERDLARIGPQVAAQEQRIEDLAERLTRWEAGESEQAEARDLIAEMRAEHRRIRERISAAARFEERLRAVEERTP